MRQPGTVLAALLLCVLTACGGAEGSEEPAPAAEGGTSADPTAEAEPTEEPTEEPTDEATEEPTEEPSEEPTEEPETLEDPVRPVSVAALAAQEHRGDRLRLGAVRERTPDYTSYDVTYRSRSTGPGIPGGEEALQISGVLNVPTGRGPFPAVVLAHGYIDPAYYVRGQGMTRERGYLAARDYVALHVDYRGHAESDGEADDARRMRLGYSADVVNAVKALRNTTRVPVDDDRIAYFGRSMGGGVVLKALIAEPGLVGAAAPWASVSSLEADNYRQFMAGDSRGSEVVSIHGSPADSPAFWRGVSSRPYLDEITEPVLLVHGRFDDTCPPPWARATQRALVAAGVDSTLEWYDDGHAFGPAFVAAMDRTIRFFDNQL